MSYCRVRVPFHRPSDALEIDTSQLVSDLLVKNFFAPPASLPGRLTTTGNVLSQEVRGPPMPADSLA